MSHEENSKLYDEFIDSLGEEFSVCEYCNGEVIRYGPDLIDHCEGCGCIEGANNPSAYYCDDAGSPEGIVLESDTKRLLKAFNVWVARRGEGQ